MTEPTTFLGAWLQVGPLLALGVWAGLSQLDSANTEVSGPGAKGRQASGPRRSGGGFFRRRARFRHQNALLLYAEGRDPAEIATP